MKLLQLLVLSGALVGITGTSMAATTHIHYHNTTKHVHKHYGHKHHRHHHRHHRHHHPRVNLGLMMQPSYGYVMQPRYVYPQGYYAVPAPRMVPTVSFSF